MMTDIRLRFPDLAAYEAAFAAVGWPTRDDEAGALLTYPSGETYFGYAGITILDVPAEIDPETGDILTPAVIAPGFHADVRLIGIETPEALVPFIVTPEQPQHRFA